METRIYVAKKGDLIRIIEAANPSQAGRHIAAEWEIKPASAKDMAYYREIDIEKANGKADT